MQRDATGSWRSESDDGGSEQTTQVVFDLDAGELQSQPAAGGDRPVATDGNPRRENDGTTGDGEMAGEPDRGLDPETRAALEDLREVDVNETPPVELVAEVQKWQEQLDDE